MQGELERVAVEHGDRLRVIPIERLVELRGVIRGFKEQAELNDFQKWIVDELYQFEKPEEDFGVSSIILIAVHHPFYSRVEFEKEGARKTFLSLVRSDFDSTEAYLREVVDRNGHTVKIAENLPLKRLGAHSGLAKYGRNNITYVDGLGSNFSYLAYFTDMVCQDDTWGEAQDAEACGSCRLCVENCPTRAIRGDRFLIDNEKCLSCVNEVPGDFPDWIPATAHHTLYDCLICQHICPMNRKQLDYVIEGISFTEEETNLLLSGEPMDTLTEELRAKIRMLGVDEWYDAIPRNLKTLFEQKEMDGRILRLLQKPK